MNTTTVALLGLGAMGSRMAQNLLQAGYSIVVYNRTKQKAEPLLEQGATYAETPRAAAAQADIVISMVTDDQVSRQIWLDAATGAAGGLGQKAIAIESSTLSVGWTKELAAELAGRGVAFLDAPVVGSRPQAEAGNLIYLVGGTAAVLAQVQPVLKAAGASAVHQIGEVGQGMAMKLAVNALFGIQVAAVAELLGMLVKQGISAEAAMASLAELPVTSPAAKLAGKLMLTGNHAPLFPIGLVEKDFRYVVQTAAAAGTVAPVSAAVQEVYQKAIAAGYENDNITGIIQLFS
ncbi:MAG: NAD(P)-dependent oxidoreductase [Elainella sp.]